jgi:hypothetical protein
VLHSAPLRACFLKIQVYFRICSLFIRRRGSVRSIWHDLGFPLRASTPNPYIFQSSLSIAAGSQGPFAFQSQTRQFFCFVLLYFRLTLQGSPRVPGAVILGTAWIDRGDFCKMIKDWVCGLQGQPPPSSMGSFRQGTCSSREL